MSEVIVAEQKPDLSPMQLLQQAVIAGADPDKLKQLTELHVQHQQRMAYIDYTAAMNKCQQAMPVIVKDAINTHTKSRYARLETVTSLIRPIYTKHGFSISFSEEPGAPDNYIRVVAEVRHEGGHSERFQTDIPRDGVGAKGGSVMTGTQGHGSTLAYARRYLTTMIFNLVIADEDTDGNAPGAHLTEEQIAHIREKFQILENLGNPVREGSFINYFGKLQGTEARVLDELQQKNYTRMLKDLDRKISEANQK